MSWQYHFGAPSGERILNSRFCGVTVYGDKNWWWVPELNRWVSSEDENIVNLARGSHFNKCRSFKAFKRHLRKYGDVLKGSEVVLCSRFVGCDITATWDA